MIYTYATVQPLMRDAGVRAAVMDPACFGNPYPELHLAKHTGRTLCGRAYTEEARYRPLPTDHVCEFCTTVTWPRGLE